MKRTKQRADRVAQAKPEHVSGCRQFEGEDLMYNDRMRLNAQNQRDWADQQIREHKQQAAMDQEEEKNWSQQEEAILRMRGMLEDENQARKVAHHQAIVAENKRMALEKRQREQAARDDGERSNQLEVTLTNHNEQLQTDGRTLRTDNWQ